MPLRPQSTVTPEALTDGQHALVLDAAWASVVGALSGGVVLVSLALALGAGPSTIGLLSAIPFLAQIAQLPAVAIVERWRQRKRLGVWTLGAARLIIAGLFLLPLLPATTPRLTWLVGAQIAICLLGSVATCAINSWLHQLLPPQSLGRFFSRRLLVSTIAACIATLATGLAIEQTPADFKMHAYALAFLGAGLAGALSTWYIARCPEPPMHDAGPPVPLLQQLRAPFADRNFRRLLVTLGAWNLASNLSAPFLAVYLLQQLGYGLGTVTVLWVVSQVANALTLYAWGRLSDRMANKSVLAVALPAYFGCALGLVFVTFGEAGPLQLALLALLHAVMGAAGGGIGLATGNLGLKLAPRDRGTSYLAAIGLVSALAGGIAPLLGGSLAQWFADRQLSLVVRWVVPGGGGELAVLAFAHWEFLFALSALLGLYVMHALSRVTEGGEVSERRVIQEFGLEALRAVNQLSSVAGVLGSVFEFGRPSERRRAARGRAPIA